MQNNNDERVATALLLLAIVLLGLFAAQDVMGALQFYSFGAE